MPASGQYDTDQDSIWRPWREWGKRPQRDRLALLSPFPNLQVDGDGEQDPSMPVHGAAGVRGGQFIARLRALLAWMVVDQGIRTLSE